MRLSEIQEGDEIVAAEGHPWHCIENGKTYQVQRQHGILCIQCKDGNHKLTSPRDVGFFRRFIQKGGGWIGVDLDATLCVYEKWEGPYVLGAPIPKMVERVKVWLAAGRDVRIFTARMTDEPYNRDGTLHDLDTERANIEAWCKEHIGRVLPITNVKDWDMMELWDDRSIQVRPNTGETLADELAAIKEAEATPKLGD